MSGESWAAIIAAIFGTVGAFIGGGMLWVASDLKKDIELLNSAVRELMANTKPRIESDQDIRDVHARQDRFESRMLDSLDNIAARIWADRTDSGINPKRRLTDK